MKKLNALCAWLSIAALLGHLGTMTYSLLTGWYDFALCKNLAYATAISVGAHVLVTLVIFFFLHDGTAPTRYLKHNMQTILQRASGLAMLLLLHAHVKSFGFIVAGEPLDFLTKAGLVATEALFFGAIFTHVATSLPKSLITLGLMRSDRAESRVRRVAGVVGMALFLLTCVALVRFVILWPSA